MIRTRLKSSSKIESAAPFEEVDRPARVLLRIGVPQRVDEVLALLPDLDPLQAVVVQPGLEAVDVPLRVRLAGLSALDRKVGVDPVRSLA